MRISIKKGTFILWMLSICFMLACLVELHKVWQSDTIIYGSWSAPAFYLSIVSLLITYLFLYVYKVKIAEFPTVMISLTYLFMFGRVWLNYLGFDSNIYWVLHKLYDPLELQRVGILTVCCTHSLFLGMMCAYRKNNNVQIEKRELEEIDKSSLYSLGIILLLIGIPCRIISDIRSVLATASSGSFTSISASTGMIDDLAFLYVPGLICLMETRTNLRKVIYIILFVYFIIIMSITGDRRYYVSAIVTFGAYIIQKGSLRSHKVKPERMLIIILVATVFLNFLEVVRKIRMGNLTSFFNFITNYGVDVFVLDNVIYDVLVEFGISFYSVVSVVSCIPYYFPYQYGMTFLKTIPSVLPVGFLFGNMFSEASPSTYINQFLSRPVGATMFGDLYANFGIFCIAGVFVFGIILGNLFRGEKAKRQGYQCMKYYTYYYILINLVRCSIFEIFRPMIWCTFIPYCILMLIKRKGVKKIGKINH